MLKDLLPYFYWIENFSMQQKYVNRSVNMEHMKNAIVNKETYVAYLCHL